MADASQTLVFQLLASRLQELGLGSLARVDASGNPAGWLWDQIVTYGQMTGEQLMLLVESTPEFTARFPVIAEQRRQAAAGRPVVPMNAAQVRAYEQQVAGILTYARMPTTMAKDWKYAQDLLAKGISVDELSKAVTVSYERVARAQPSVRAYMASYFGVDGDAMLAGYFLDPDHIDANLETISRAASIGGYAADRNLFLGKDTAMRIAQLGYEGSQLTGVLGQVAEQSHLLTNTISETGKLTDDQAVLAATGLDERSRKAIRGRQEKRVAAFAGGGGAIMDETGLATGRASEKG